MLKMFQNEPLPSEGILLIDKPRSKTSFFVVATIRKKTGQKKIGHAGTLDPFATGLLVLLLGKNWTRKAGLFLHHDKEYEAVFCLGRGTDTYDCDGKIVQESTLQPSQEDLEKELRSFQGMCAQTPPMFSAKKIDGTRLYELARKGIEVERKKVDVMLETTLLSYEYPFVSLRIKCSKGTYIRSIAQDLGENLGCFAHVASLKRMASGPLRVENSISLADCISLSSDQLQKRLLTCL